MPAVCGGLCPVSCLAPGSEPSAVSHLLFTTNPNETHPNASCKYQPDNEDRRWGVVSYPGRREAVARTLHRAPVGQGRTSGS